MKKKNEHLLYVVLLSFIVLSILSVYFIRDNIVVKDILFVACGLSCFLLGICVSGARNTYYYNKAMDAWANFQEQLKKELSESEKAESKTEDAFKEFGGGSEQ